MTRLLGKGRTLTNASVDRIDGDGGYEIGNVRLVCNVVNMMRYTMTDDELKWWCRQILGL